MTSESYPLIQLTCAIKNNSAADVSYWAPLCSKSQCTDALVLVCSQGKTKCATALIPYAQEYKRALWSALGKKNIGCVKMLLPLTHVKIDHPNFAEQEEDKTYCLLQHAVKHNMPNFIDLLLPYTDPFDRNQCLAMALMLNHSQCIEKLLFKADFKAATHIFKSHSSAQGAKWQSVLDHYSNIYQAHTLNTHIKGEAKHSKSNQRKI